MHSLTHYPNSVMLMMSLMLHFCNVYNCQSAFPKWCVCHVGNFSTQIIMITNDNLQVKRKRIYIV